ncbi:uncharacterized protein LOC129777741 [Toxorhynchites rutilus septentrionalis]|uniref:uncharacterized protein LOC129777741 n=1 Tax=Toxorhynchites rutilus septentrionalis TaxID=329112 RepID=UPI00247A0885|nr:uncharacterized protein LOC129777741 [Toxorhynchites rutilus septentrionalis]
MTARDEQINEKDTESGYLENLLNDAATIPIDADVDGYTIEQPPWYDAAKFKRGQQFALSNRAGIVTAALCGLIAVLAIPSILDVLNFTKRSSTPRTAYKRYILTILHTLNWYKEDMRPGTKAWKSLAYVRRIHVTSGKQAHAANAKMLVSQKDVAITQFGFVGYVVLGYQKLGIQYDEEGMEGFVHFWRTIGYMLGLEDRFNLCTADMDSSRRRLVLVNDQIIRPSLQFPSDDFVRMTNAMIDGLWCLSTMLDYHAFMFLTRRLSNLPGHYYWDTEPRDGAQPIFKEFNWYSRVMLYFLMVVHEVLLNITVFRWYFNWQFKFNTEVVNEYFPWLAIIKFGVKDAYVRIVY